MQKKVLTEQAIYYGDVTMPKDWEIDRNELSNYILQSNIRNSEFLFSRTWSKLNKYIIEHIRLRHKLDLQNKETWGNIYKPTETTIPLLHINPVDLQNSPDFVLLYGVLIEECNVTIHYDNNRKKGNTWNIPLENNKFIMFPSTNMYYITNNQKRSLNFVQTITYDQT